VEASCACASAVVEIASAVSGGTLKASDVVEEYLKRISDRESEIHAFNLVTAEQAKFIRDYRWKKMKKKLI
jgi:Asp-tRNA(Asn)/Glu-tRNA(Gln) amidotransferase A subunit family amidase